MEFAVPDYYEEFRCLQGQCKHNCCIGWEIDIDDDTKAFYDTVQGDFGARLQASIDTEGEPHFRLGKQERCPFLNDDNLCDIIIALGEERLCDICAMHPRFCNELPYRTEMGLGLCCEAAARLILTRNEPMTLVVEGTAEQEDSTVTLRDRVIALLQKREFPLPVRVEQLLTLCKASVSAMDAIPFFLSLERLDDAWTKYLRLVQETAVDPQAVSRLATTFETEYEQLLVYLIYRHFVNAPSPAHAAAFVALIYELITKMSAAHRSTYGTFTVEDLLELARLFSAEIEYSDENLHRIWSAL